MAHRQSPTRTVALTSDAITAFGRRGKAVRLAIGERLTRLEHLSYGLTAVYLVEGDHSRYRCTLYGKPPGPLSATCTCPARGLCSHMVAAKAAEESTLDGAAAAVIA